MIYYNILICLKSLHVKTLNKNIYNRLTSFPHATLCHTSSEEEKIALPLLLAIVDLHYISDVS